jgi:hypothetical protein
MRKVEIFSTQQKILLTISFFLDTKRAPKQKIVTKHCGRTCEEDNLRKAL